MILLTFMMYFKCNQNSPNTLGIEIIFYIFFCENSIIFKLCFCWSPLLFILDVIRCYIRLSCSLKSRVCILPPLCSFRIFWNYIIFIFVFWYTLWILVWVKFRVKKYKYGGFWLVDFGKKKLWLWTLGFKVLVCHA